MILDRSLDILTDLELEQIVIVVDQAIYTKIQEIRWKEKGVYLEKIVIRLGEFHTSMSFLSAIGKRFADAGLQEIFIVSGLVAEGSISQVISGHKYNRSVRCHKIVCEALFRLQFQAFLASLPSQEAKEFVTIVEMLRDSYPSEFDDTSKSSDILNIVSKFDEWVSKECSENSTFCLWTSYISMVHLLLAFIRATREGNWNLHLASVKAMLPWFFAYDRIHYMRSLSLYFKEMSGLSSYVLSSFKDGLFSVQRKLLKPFSKTAMDQVCEQTVNKDTKTRGGMVYFQKHESNCNNWLYSHLDKAEIVRNLLDITLTDLGEHSHAETTKTRIKLDEEAVLSVMETIESFYNPFVLFHEPNDLINITSGSIADSEVNKSYSTALEKGKFAYDQFVNQRLVQGDINFNDKITTLRLSTFSSKSNIKPETSILNSVLLKDNAVLQLRILLSAKTEDYNLKKLAPYPLSLVPLSLGLPNGLIRKTAKHKIIPALESKLSTQLSSKIPCLSNQSCLIFDAMATIHLFKRESTFSEFSSKILTFIIDKARFLKCKRVDFVIDRYMNPSIKSPERERRGNKSSHPRIMPKGDQKMPSSLSDFLEQNINKTSLLEFLFGEWSNSFKEENLTLFICRNNFCFKIQFIEGQTSCTQVPELTSDHEEADTRMFLHAHHCKLNGFDQVFISSIDTDVCIIALSMYSQIGINVFIIRKGKSFFDNILDVDEMVNKVGQKRANALIGLHSFSGCDTVSSFFGKGKLSFVNDLFLNEEVLDFCLLIGTEWDLFENLKVLCEKVTCTLYSKKGFC